MANLQAEVMVENFTMRFGGRTVVDDLSFEVKPGEVFGFLGSNGSGKTTTIRALLGMYHPAAGTLLIEGHVFQPWMGTFLGYLPEERGLYKKESVLDTMVYFGQLKGMSRTEARSWSLTYLERVDLEHAASMPLDRLSGGMQQKVQLGVTMMHQPRLLILDEPTKGFDPVNRRLLMEMLEERVADGATVILVTHQMEEVERQCSRILLLKQGRRRLYGAVDEIRRQFGSNVIRLEFRGKLPNKLKTAEIQLVHDRLVRLLPKEATPQLVLAELVKSKELLIESFVVEQPSLDDIFVQIYQEDEVKRED